MSSDNTNTTREVHLIPPSSIDDLPLTPGTRSAAEAALTHNTLTQTASAGRSDSISGPSSPANAASPVTGRPPFPTRSSNNYIDAITAISSASVNPVAIPAGGRARAKSLGKAPGGLPLPLPSHGSLDADDELMAQNEAAEQELLEQQAAAKRTSVDMRSTGLKSPTEVQEREGEEAVPRMLGQHGRQMSWEQRDMRRLMQEPLMKEGVAKGGYSGEGGAVTGQ